MKDNNLSFFEFNLQYFKKLQIIENKYLTNYEKYDIICMLHNIKRSLYGETILFGKKGFLSFLIPY